MDSAAFMKRNGQRGLFVATLSEDEWTGVVDKNGNSKHKNPYGLANLGFIKEPVPGTVAWSCLSCCTTQ
jgi:hypothetical protein